MIQNGAPTSAVDAQKSQRGVKGPSALSKLPYWDMSKNHLVDYMHSGKNTFQRVFESLVGQDYAPTRPRVPAVMTKLRIPKPDAGDEVRTCILDVTRLGGGVSGREWGRGHASKVWGGGLGRCRYGVGEGPCM
jgi:hypothetical protein